MDYPKALVPTAIQEFDSPRGICKIPKTCPVFQPWQQDSPGDSYGSKVFLEYRGHPMFAELVILGMFKDAGWEGVWVDSFRKAYWTSDYKKLSGGLPVFPSKIIKQIRGSDKFPQGCWDLICWRDNTIIFVEAKHTGKDKIRPTQTKWLSKAMDAAANLSADNFLVVEWALAK